MKYLNSFFLILPAIIKKFCYLDCIPLFLKDFNSF